MCLTARVVIALALAGIWRAQEQLRLRRSARRDECVHTFRFDGRSFGGSSGGGYLRLHGLRGGTCLCLRIVVLRWRVSVWSFLPRGDFGDYRAVANCRAFTHKHAPHFARCRSIDDDETLRGCVRRIGV